MSCILSILFLFSLDYKKQRMKEQETTDTPSDRKMALPDIKKVSEIIPSVPDVHWAPLTGIPFERRIQMAVVLMWIFLLGNCLTIFCCSLFVPFLWPLHIAYIIYLYRDQSPENGGRRSDWFRRLPIWNYYAGYFPAKLVKASVFFFFLVCLQMLMMRIIYRSKTLIPKRITSLGLTHTASSVSVACK